MGSQLKWIGVLLAGLALAGLAAWFFFLRDTAPATEDSSPAIGLGVGDDRTVVVPPASTDTDSGAITSEPQAPQKIFKVADGPITTATLVQTALPTTTLARYVLQENGHAFDLVLDSAGAVPRALSNTTIPGTVRGVWAQRGGAVILQYQDAGIVKSVYLGFPPISATSTDSTRPVQIRFFPDNVSDLASSPNGGSVAYLLSTNAGTDGYTANPDGTASKKLFSLPFSETTVSWPSQGTLLLSTKSAAGVPGAAFSVNAQSGGASPMLYAPGLTLAADRTFSNVVYRTASAANAASFTHDVKTGKESGLSYDPIPEKCVWSPLATSTMYCALPLQYVPGNYLDLWHQGTASAADGIVSFVLPSGQSAILAVPGESDGGVPSDIAEMAVSPDEKYLLFIKKNDQSLWGVRLK